MAPCPPEVYLRSTFTTHSPHLPRAQRLGEEVFGMIHVKST